MYASISVKFEGCFRKVQTVVLDPYPKEKINPYELVRCGGHDLYCFACFCPSFL